MILTQDIFEKGKSSKGGWNKKQYVLLGIQKLYNGWKLDIIGKDYPEETINQFLLLTDDHLIKKIPDPPKSKEPVNPNNIILTKELFFTGKSRNGGWGNKQIAALGEEIPLVKGWRKRLIGKECDPVAVKRFLFLKNKHLDEAEFENRKRYFDSIMVVNQDLSFNEQYHHPKWVNLRSRILYRDNYRCEACESKSRPLHVHHTVYQRDKFIWEIDENLLMTLCQTCHENMHERSFENFEKEETI